MKDRVSSPAMVKQTCLVASEMTGNNVLRTDFVEQEESSIMGSQKKDSSEWTNEKHSLYLKSIEASFVDQLYNSLDIQSCHTQKTCSSDAISSWKNNGNTSGQFKVLQAGRWSKKNFRRENSQLKDADKPHVSPGNPWIQHFTNGSRHGAVAFPTLQERPSSTAISLQSPVPESQLHQDSAEVTDQNFVEDTSIHRTHSRKRMRTCIAAHASNDQVVPFCTSPATEIADTYVSPKE
ncbi:uncharacterized protein LOC112509870 [Cynara cardunculus var. scolymus]|uniref:Uncharacterized protein n=1 Tax=Cynara cardunculus var. scolymus TaxID=59895 RepID=A0A124SGK1_CYNCS|nr:uncharacterized protein LOC112509870 [Cynara cardunculus var. scolymus]KVI06643.1 hypothetical protein Ccrd_015004 [Cynara cardunculus var. scolymus]